MLGLIHIIFKDFILEKFGDAAWSEILQRAGIADDSTIMDAEHMYPDELTFTAVELACDVLKVDKQVALESFGAYFVGYAVKSGFYACIKSLGSTLFDLLTNLNMFHHNLERDFRQGVFPTFLVQSEDGSCDKLQLTYQTTRLGLNPLLKGVLIAAADTVFNVDLTMELLKAPGVDSGLRAANKGEDTEVIWRLIVKHRVCHPNDGLGETIPPTSRYSFFDFHRLFVSCCRVEDPTQTIELIPVHSSTAAMEPVIPDENEVKPEGEKARESDDLETSAHIRAQLDAEYEAKKDAIRNVYAHAPEEEVMEGSHVEGARLTGKVEQARIATLLFRGASADRIGSPWTDADKLKTASKMWHQDSRLEEYYTWSQDWIPQTMHQEVSKQLSSGSLSEAVGDLIRKEEQRRTRRRSSKDILGQGQIVFLSQSWKVPQLWHEVMGEVLYGELKATEVCCVAKDLAATLFGSHKRWDSVMFWLDKLCIPQKNAKLMQLCVGLLEEFIQLCDGLVVLLPWSYFDRLWCVYEWVCFLVHHPLQNVTLCCDAFMRPRTLPLYIACIKDFSLSRCQCFVEDDRKTLLAKVHSYYVSEESFETFLKISAIALIARDMATRRTALGAASITPWAELARDCGFAELSARLFALGDLCAQWWEEATIESRQEAGQDDEKKASSDIQSSISVKVETWFAKELVPLVEAVKETCTKPHSFEVCGANDSQDSSGGWGSPNLPNRDAGCDEKTIDIDI